MNDIRDPELYFGDDGQPRSGRFGDIYYSTEDGLSESRAVFLKGCHMTDVWAGRRHFTTGELGFGTGLNLCALLELWTAHRPEGGHLHVFSVEGFLMQAEAARRALSAWPELGDYAEAIVAQWPPQRRGFHHMAFPQWGVSLTLALMDVREALDAWDGKADAWFLDGFSPALNPDMWAEDVLERIGARSQPGTRLATFTVAGSVRRGLEAAGFTVAKVPGFGKKREQLEAIYAAEEAVPEVPPPSRVAVIGAGIAGVSVARALEDFGIAADLFDAVGPGGGASGNRAGLVTPRLDAGGGDISDLFADGFYYARDLYERLCPEAMVSRGVLQRPSGPRDPVRFAKVAQQSCFAAGDMQVQAEGLWMAQALAIDPLAVLEALKGSQTLFRERIVACERTPDGWRLKGEVHTYEGYERLFVACGEGLFDLMPQVSAQLGLRPVRGQIEIARTSDAPQQASAWGGYYVPVPGGFVFGATHVRDDRSIQVRLEERARNIDTLSQAFPDLAASVAPEALVSRASVRMTARDHLPVMGDVDGLWLLSGLGGRGFCLGPLLGRALVCRALGLASPLSLRASSLLDWRRLS